MEAPKDEQIVALLIDMQPGFVERVTVANCEILIQNQLRIIRLCVIRNVPLIVIEYQGHGETIPELLTAMQGVKRIMRVEKWNDNAFSNPELLKHLQELEADTLLLTGINASYCVLDTAAAAVLHGYKILTADRLIENGSHQPSDKALDWYKANGTLFPTMRPILRNLVLR